MKNKTESADLRSLLAAKWNVTERQVYNRAKELADRASITTAEGIWVLAAQNQINLTKYLPPEVVERVRNLLLQVPAPARIAPELAGKTNQKALKKAPTEFVVAKVFKGSDPILPAKVYGEASEMASVYPLLYMLENSIREFLRRIIDARLGLQWWTTSAQTKIRGKILKRMSDDEKDAWHQRRGSHPIDYLDFIELSLIVKNNEDLFVPQFLPTVQWFEQFVLEAYKSRCVVCHMNPLEKDNVKDVKLKLRKWQRHAKEKGDSLPPVTQTDPANT
ncbi:MAG: hypothetical protein WCC98_16765 [Candidatus Acidiferrales bacterium]